MDNALSFDKLPVNWFDIALVATLVLGFWRGRKHGMSEELLPLIQWVVIVVAGAALYRRLGQAVAQATVFSLLSCYVGAYIGIALGVRLVFALIKKALGGKLTGSNLFGSGEYYLGMVSGVMRFACGLLVALALLNARYFSPEEIKAMEKYQVEVYGSRFFPGLQSVQSQVFQRSLLGPQIRNRLGFLLIQPTAPEKKSIRVKEKDANLLP